MKTRNDMFDNAALLIVDMQNDFCPGGAIPVKDGDCIVATLNRYIDAFVGLQRPVFASRDWHPADSTHFLKNGGTWQVHCLQNSPGARFHPALRLPSQAVIISKGVGCNEQGYSAFEGADAQGRPLDGLLDALKIDRLLIGGLATDYCVKATVLAARRNGFRVDILTDAIKGVDLKPGDSERALEAMTLAGGELFTFARMPPAP
jgi:nicotinamidase/pyrazinamidase